MAPDALQHDGDGEQAGLDDHTRDILNLSHGGGSNSTTDLRHDLEAGQPFIASAGTMKEKDPRSAPNK